jgi:RHS repeat-associated protein
VPCGRQTVASSLSIVSDYLGTPTHAFDEQGALVWERELDCYGATRKLKGEKDFCPYLYQGQYVDEETGLAYNRFRYYDAESGNYISQDPIGVEGGNPTMYGYVHDINSQIDPFGLDELDALTAKKDGWYPVMEYGKSAPIGEVYLKEGELWKIGTSKDASKRYTQKYLAGIGVQLDVLHTNISRKTSLFLENLKLKGYLSWKGYLPAGNKCKH